MHNAPTSRSMCSPPSPTWATPGGGARRRRFGRRGHAAVHQLDQPVRKPPSCRPPRPAAGADYRVRIFCPAPNAAFAATPRWAPATPWLQAGPTRTPGRIVQECGGPGCARTASAWPCRAAAAQSGPWTKWTWGASRAAWGWRWRHRAPRLVRHNVHWRAVLLRSAESWWR